MITIEQLEEALGDDNTPFKVKDVDHKFIAIDLLRKRIPYDKCENIIGAAEHDQIYLCDAEMACEFLMQEDLPVLAECNCFIDEDSISLFV